MFEFHTLGTLAASAVLMGAFQLGEPPTAEAREAGVTGSRIAKVLPDETRKSEDLMRAQAGLSTFAHEREARSSPYATLAVAWDKLTDNMARTSRAVIASFTD